MQRPMNLMTALALVGQLKFVMVSILLSVRNIPSGTNLKPRCTIVWQLKAHLLMLSFRPWRAKRRMTSATILRCVRSPQVINMSSAYTTTTDSCRRSERIIMRTLLKQLPMLESPNDPEVNL